VAKTTGFLQGAGHWDLRYGSISLFFLRYFGIFLEKLRYYNIGNLAVHSRYLQFWTQKLRLLTKFACCITVLNTPQCPPTPVSPLVTPSHSLNMERTDRDIQDKNTSQNE
jgi:hypothetical protein